MAPKAEANAFEQKSPSSLPKKRTKNQQVEETNNTTKYLEKPTKRLPKRKKSAEIVDEFSVEVTKDDTTQDSVSDEFSRENSNEEDKIASEDLDPPETHTILPEEDSICQTDTQKRLWQNVMIVFACILICIFGSVVKQQLLGKHKSDCDYSNSYFPIQLFATNLKNFTNHIQHRPSYQSRNLKQMERLIARYLADVEKNKSENPLILTFLSAASRKTDSLHFARDLARTFSSRIRLINEIPQEYQVLQKELKAKVLSPPGHLVIISDLDKIPAQAASVLQSFCDNQNSPCPSASYIFLLSSTELESMEGGSLEHTDVEKISHQLLTDAWSRDLPPRILDPLLSRVLNIVFFV